jgi:NADPH-dependent curcumin reductase CurA
MTVNGQWRLAAHPEGLIKPSDFRWIEEPLREPREGEALIRVLYLSLDPTHRIWASGRESYVPPVAIGEVMRGGALGVVEASRNPKLPVGARVRGLLGWQQYALSDGRGLSALPDDASIPLTAHLGLFGHIGMTAYFGLLDIGRPQPGETLVVSAAAGAVGSLVGQIGKIHGCRVVGIAGSADKCRWIIEELGFDAAIDHRREDVGTALGRLCPNGIDIDFENVGGDILDAILARINLRARIVLCGLIAQYNATGPVPGPTNFAQILMKRARVEGFIVSDFLPRAAEATAALARWLAEGKLKYRVDVVKGLRNAPAALNRLFDGSNTGKLIIEV